MYHILQCGEEPSAREEINKLDGLPMLLKLLHDGLKGDIELLAASTGAIWKSVVNNKENIRW